MVASAPARTGADIRNSTPCGTLVQYYLSQDILNYIRWENKSMIEMFSNAQICSIYKVIEIYRTVLYSTVQNVWHWKFFSYNVHFMFYLLMLDTFYCVFASFRIFDWSQNDRLFVLEYFKVIDFFIIKPCKTMVCTPTWLIIINMIWMLQPVHFYTLSKTFKKPMCTIRKPMCTIKKVA